MAALILLALAVRFVWWFATEEDFALAAGIIWGLGFAAAYFVALDDIFVARMPAGFLAFALTSTITLPVSWLAGSKIALVALLVAQLAFSFNAGRALSNRLRERVLPRYPAGTEPAWLRQEGDLIAELGRWAVLAFVAIMFVTVAPLLVFLVVSLMIEVAAPEMKLSVAVWGLAGTAWYGIRTRAVRWVGVPACAWVYASVTAAIVVADLLAGPFAHGTGVQVAYTALPGALAAALVEVFVLGGGRLDA